MEAADFIKSEYEQLMAESRLHLTTASAIVSLTIASLGVGIPVAINHLYVLPALAGLTLVLWLRYLDHVSGMYRVAAYVALALHPKLHKLTRDDGVFCWEFFFRRLRREGSGGEVGRERLGERVLGLGYTSALFGLAPPTMLVVFLVQELTKSNGRPAAAIVISSLGGLLWLFSLIRFYFSAKWIGDIDKSIEAAGAAAEAEAEAGQSAIDGDDRD